MSNTIFRLNWIRQECQDAIDNLFATYFERDHMQPGELVINIHTKRRLTVKATGGSGFVLCSWMEADTEGRPVECSAAFDWRDLRAPTPEERAQVPAPVAELPALADLDVPMEPDEPLPVPAEHKRKR